MKNKLGITEGLSFSPSKQDGCHGHAILAQVFNEDTGRSVCSFNPTDSELEATRNAELTADAFETANKCGKLPSELLKERDELLEALKSCNSDLVDALKHLNKYQEQVEHDYQSAYEYDKIIQSIEKDK